MSAGICIMNKDAIAMAADSAVTIGNHAAIHNSANKLFALSYVAPVGAIVYSNSELMNIPMEVIVKEFKKSLSNKTYRSLEEYVKSFILHLEHNGDFYRFNRTESDYILNSVCGVPHWLDSFLEIDRCKCSGLSTGSGRSKTRPTI